MVVHVHRRHSMAFHAFQVHGPLLYQLPHPLRIPIALIIGITGPHQRPKAQVALTPRIVLVNHPPKGPLTENQQHRRVHARRCRHGRVNKRQLLRRYRNQRLQPHHEQKEKETTTQKKEKPLQKPQLIL